MRFSIKKVLVFLAFVWLVIFLLYLSKSSQSNNINPDDVGKLNLRDVPKKPVFKEDGGLGNFEPPSGAPRRTGPGENGQAHHLRPDQKAEEERLTSEFLFCLS